MGQINENITAIGQLDVVLTGSDGAVKENIHIPNLVVTVGKEWIAARMADTGIPGEMSHMAVGSGTTAAANGDTALGTELGRVALDTSGGSVAATSTAIDGGSFN